MTMKQVKLPDHCQVRVGQTDVTLLMAFAEVAASDIPALERVFGGPLQEAPADTYPMYDDVDFAIEAPNPLGSGELQQHMEAMQRLGLAQQVVTLFLNSKVRCQMGGGGGGVANDGEAWKHQGNGLELSDRETELYNACLQTLTNNLRKGLES